MKLQQHPAVAPIAAVQVLCISQAAKVHFFVGSLLLTKYRTHRDPTKKAGFGRLGGLGV